MAHRIASALAAVAAALALLAQAGSLDELQRSAGDAAARATGRAVERKIDGNPVEVVEIGEARWAKSRDPGNNQQWALMDLRYAIKGDLPPRFTVELDAALSQGLSVHFTAPHGFGGQSVFVHRRVEFVRL